MTLLPQSEAEVQAAVADALARSSTLAVEGLGSKRGLGRPMQAVETLSLRALSGIVTYEPEELILTAQAGTPRDVIEATLAQRGQFLAFEPPDFSALFGSDSAGTLGGLVACNLSGPRRFAAGAARDFVLGLRAVSGRGEVFKAGGRVVKNVTGYDLPKLLTGSHGTLAVLTELTLKVLPAPEETETLVLRGLPDAQALGLLRGAISLSVEPTGLAHLPGVVAPSLGETSALTLFRLEGPAPSVKDRSARLRDWLVAQGAPAVETRDNAPALWRALRDALPFAGEVRRDDLIWRLSLPPASAATVGARLAALPDVAFFYDWAGGLIWVAAPAALPAASIRDALQGEGHATLFRAPDSIRALMPVFPPQADGVAALSRRIKDQFDPRGILNPGRMEAAP